MILNKIFENIKEKFNRPDKKQWLNKLVKEIETHRYNFDSLPFKIVELKGSGFLVKVHGLFAFISFYHMPWKYPDTDSWKAISPNLINKVFFCKVHKIEKEPLFIIINGEIPQFKRSELLIGKQYIGLIIKKVTSGLFIDIGYHFDWKCGSLLGFLHKSQFGKNDNDNEIGQEIKIFYQGLNKDGRLVFSNNTANNDWQLGKPQELIGQTIWAKVIKKPGSKEVRLLVKGKYKATLTFNKHDYVPKYRKKIKWKKNELIDGEIVNCEVIGFNEQKKILKVNWLVEVDTDIVADNSIMNNLDNDTIQKLTKIKNEIET